MVIDDADSAHRLAAAGESVVLIVAETTPWSSIPSPGPGRMALMVGSGDDPAVRAAAAEMDSELFGRP